MKSSKGVGVGSASVIVIFVLLCLACFGVLSFVSARADLRLAQQTAQAMTSYYEADSRAISRIHGYEKLLTSISTAGHSYSEVEHCLNCAQAITGFDPTVEVGEDNSLTFFEPIDENRELKVTLLIAAPNNGGNRLYPVSWLVIPLFGEQYAEEQELNLWQGMEELDLWK